MKTKSDILGMAALLFTSAIYVSPALANQTFLDPRIDGRYVDRCIKSYRFPDACSSAAGAEVARRFCIANGYTNWAQYQTLDYSWKNRKPTVKWYEEWADGVLEEHFKPEEGGFVFTAIECR